jgi:DNA polymerase elongation subunit (family B)
LSDWKSNFVKLNAVRGWLFDVYPSGPNEVTVWVIAENGERVRLVDKFTHRIYVSGNSSDLKDLAEKVSDSKSVAGLRFVEKYADFMEASKRKVLEVDTSDYGRTSFFAKKILRIGGYEQYRLYNVDVSIAQAYLYEKDIFPLVHVMVVDSGNRLSYEVLDSVESCEYIVPPIRSMWLSVKVKKEGGPARFSDKIDSISLDSNSKTMVISEGSEADKILELVKAVKGEDPDIIFTHGGDSFLFPYLAYRAFVNGILNRFVLSREDVPLRAKKGKGRSFFSYGRVYHTAPMRRLYGRVHIDVDNTFIYTACGLDGLVEVSRTCRVPLHRAARGSIGSIMSSLQLYTAWKNDLLIPWKKREPESFKSGWELLVADRGGFIFEPKLGFHTDVVEVDFTSMFPMLMLTRNISAETVLCKCCPNSKLRVPELDYNVCEKRLGIVPKTLDLLLKKRLKYKGLMRETSDEKLKQVYDMRQGALKWILVTCFGYLGYRNARFGRVDAHIAVCAFARDALLKTVRLAEENGFEVVHGIVDSLWLKKAGVSPREVAEFCKEASKAIGVPLNVEGKYRWIVFSPSKVSSQIPVLNRYYGVFEDGRIKMRGIEARRGDTPLFIEKAQIEMIKVLAKASNYEQFLERIQIALDALKEYAEKLISKSVNVEELLIAKRLSKHPSGYAHDVFQAIASRQLMGAGFDVYPGQTVQYLITDSKSKRVNERVLAEQLIKDKANYDVEKYLDLLVSAADTLLGVFGYNSERIRDLILYREKQLILN